MWDGRGAAAMFADRAASRTALDRIGALLAANQARGVMFDFEQLPPGTHHAYRAFLAMARARLPGMQIAVSVPVADPAWDLKAYARVADRLFLMAYDEHSEAGDPGPIASRPWFADMVARAVRGLPPEKVVVALGAYAYDWTHGGGAEAHSVEEALLTARES